MPLTEKNFVYRQHTIVIRVVFLCVYDDCSRRPFSIDRRSNDEEGGKTFSARLESDGGGGGGGGDETFSAAVAVGR